MKAVSRRAFTLVEMLIVVVLLSLALAITVRAVGKMQANSERQETITRLKAVGQALQRYRDDWGDVPPYNPNGRDYNGDGQPDAHGPGLWALVQLDYLSGYRFLSDSARPIASEPAGQVGDYRGHDPWVTDPSGGRIEVVPGDPVSMGRAFNAYCSAYGEAPIAGLGRELSAREEALVYDILARPADHSTPACSNFGAFDDYEDRDFENFSSFMMRDPFTREWKYEPIRATAAVGATGNTFPAGDPTQPDYYHRQLGHGWTDDDSPRYLPAGDTVVTWSHLFRQTERREWEGYGEWGCDVVLFADGHVEVVPGPRDASDLRAVVRPAPR